MNLDVTVTPGPFAPGEQVSGTVRVLEGGEVRELITQLVYAEETDDHSGAMRRVRSAPLATGQLTAGQAFPFTLVLPEDALPNQTGQHGRVRWIVVAIADIAHGIDANAFVPLELTLAPVS